MTAERSMPGRASIARRALLVVAIVAVALTAWTAIRLWVAWDDIERVAFEPGDARDALDSPSATGPTTTLGYVEEEVDPLAGQEPVVGGSVAESAEEFAAAQRAAADGAMDVYLILGSDERGPLELSRRADVILLFIIPTDGSTPVLVSLPRDLYIPNPCTGSMSRINVNLNGCGPEVNGPEQVAVAVENFTGITVDHFVVFTFSGFRAIIDRVGGVQICTPTAVWDPGVDPVPLDLPAGCTIAEGQQALAWVRSRHTLGWIDGQWVSVGSNDLVRNKRQQDVIIQALRKLSQMRDISELTALAEDLSEAFTIDEGLSLSEAATTAWSLRSIDVDSIARPVLPVADYIDPQGRWVLVPQATFESLVIAVNPGLAPYFSAAG